MSQTWLRIYNKQVRVHTPIKFKHKLIKLKITNQNENICMSVISSVEYVWRSEMLNEIKSHVANKHKATWQASWLLSRRAKRERRLLAANLIYPSSHWESYKKQGTTNPEVHTSD